MVSPSIQEIVGGGLLCLVRQVTVSILSSVTVNVSLSFIEVFVGSIEMEVGGTREDMSTNNNAMITYPELSGLLEKKQEHPDS